MSYILEALKRADVERKRGQETDIQTMVVAGDGSRRAWLSGGRWIMVAMGVLLVAAGWGVSAWLSRPRMVSSSITPPAPPQAAAVGATDVASPAQETLASSEASAALGRVNHLEQAVKHAQPAPPSEEGRPASSPASEAEEMPQKPVPKPLAELQNKVSRPDRSSRLNNGAAVVLMQLPASVRAQLPPLKISALIDHVDPAKRVAMINGRALHIGQYVSAAVQLVDIHQQSVELMFQGYRLLMTPFDRWPPGEH